MRRTTKLMACLLLACATLTARALDRTFLEGNDVTMDKLTSLSALDVSKMITQSSLDNNGLTASVGVRRNQNLLHGMTFTHDGVTGNLMERTGMFSYGEEFAYDDLDRLTSYTAQNGTKDITYAGNGNILSHTDRGTFTYNSSKPHAVETVGSVTHPVLSQAMGCGFTYNGFGKATHLHDGMLLSAINNYDLDITYGPDRERWKSVETGSFPSGGGGITPHAIAPIGSSSRTNLYAGDYERIDGTSYYYLDGGVIYVKPATSAGQAYYALTDHLGSYVRLYTMAGDSVLIASYDPWGNRTTTKNTLKFHRGFTGHEHLTTYGVINMNGRMYDPTVGRFLAPDNFVQMPDFSQSFNRYSYCLNNPLKYVDRDGKLAWFIPVIAAVVGGAMNVVANKDHIDNFWKGLSYFAVGAGAGVAGAYTGAAFWGSGGIIGGMLSGATGGFTSGFITGGFNSVLSTGSFNGFLDSAMTTGINSAAIGAFIGGAVGGTTAIIEGKDIWYGTLKGNPMAEVNPRVSPYQKGQEGVTRAINEFEAEGGEILHKEVTIKVEGVKHRADFVGKLDGEIIIYEVKNGPYSRLTPNQKFVLPKLQEGVQFIPVGKNAVDIPAFHDFVINRQYYTGNYTFRFVQYD